MNISHYPCVGNSSRVVPAHFAHSHKALASAASRSVSNSCALPQKPHSQKSTKDKLEYKTESKAARLVSISHDRDSAGFMDQADNANHNTQSPTELFNSKSQSRKTITVLISFLKLSKYDDAWLKLGKQLLLLHKTPNKQKFYRSALCCFKSSIKAHPDNHVAYYFSGIILCLLGRYEEAVRMFLSSLRKNAETSTTLLHTLSEMLSITEGIRLATGGEDVNGIGNSDAAVQQDSSSNNRDTINKDSIFNKTLDKLEMAIINKLQRCKIEGAVSNSMAKEQEQWNRYFELGMYWYGREQGNHKSLMYFRRCLQLNPKNEQANYYVGLIMQKQGRYHESLEAYKQAISLRPDEGFYYYMASQVYTDLEESKEAIEMIDKAISLSPKDIAYRNMKEHILRAFGIEQDLVDIVKITGELPKV
ncbi:tetratricopeptide repeat protein [Rickettsia felis]|nr:tetratricopeptide repeat protein [Rickettsia felis]